LENDNTSCEKRNIWMGGVHREEKKENAVEGG